MRLVNISALAVSLAIAASAAACSEQEVKSNNVDYVDAQPTTSTATRFTDDKTQKPAYSPS